MGKVVDFTSNDHYPKGGSEADPAKSAQDHDGTRNMGKEKYFWLMEALSEAVPGGKTLRPGEIRKFTYQAISRGMRGILYFRWRTIPFGQEQFWYGIFNHDNRINRRYKEVQRIGQELSDFSDLDFGWTLGSIIFAEIGEKTKRRILGENMVQLLKKLSIGER